MEDKLIRTKLNDKDILPAEEGKFCYIGEHAFPVAGYISTEIGDIPIASIPVMSDEKWLELSKNRGVEVKRQPLRIPRSL